MSADPLDSAPAIPPTAGNRSPDTGSPQAHMRFRPDIEGLRAVAVLAVVLFHAGVPGVGGGFVGVDVFFVISGFLITGTAVARDEHDRRRPAGEVLWSAGPQAPAGVGRREAS